jgi:intraflagellar transport protein 81
LDGIKNDFGEMNIDKMIRSLKEEVAINEKLVQEKLPKQLNDYRERVRQLQEQLVEPLDADQLSREVQQLEHEIKAIEDKSRPKLTSADEATLGLFRQQAALVVNRKEKFLGELDVLKEQKQKLEEELESKEQEFRGYQGSKILKGEEFKQYANALRGKSTNYKRLKTELQDLKSELGILQRTEEVLNQEGEAIDKKVQELEKAKGIDGYRGVKDGLVSISETKMEIDEAEGKTLEELSKVWAQLSAYPTFYKKQDRRACVNVICFFEANFLPKMSATHWNH